MWAGLQISGWTSKKSAVHVSGISNSVPTHLVTSAFLFFFLQSKKILFFYRPMQNKLQILVGDVLKTDLPFFDVCVANLPYQVEVFFSFLLISCDIFISSVTFLNRADFIAVCLQTSASSAFLQVQRATEMLFLPVLFPTYIYSLWCICSGAPCWCSRESSPCVWWPPLGTRSTADCPSILSCWLGWTISWRSACAFWCLHSQSADPVCRLCLAQVGKNNFRPPPKVESSVVRIEPKNPPPPINFQVSFTWVMRPYRWCQPSGHN